MLDMHKLMVFVTVAETGSFTAAADHLYLTQSAVSQHVRDLENQLGTQLFRRTGRGAEPTSTGQTLQDYAQRLFWLMAEAENAVIDVKNLANGHLRLGATSSAAVYLLPLWIREFRYHYPALRVSLQTDDAGAIAQRLLTNQIDLGFVEGEWEQSPRLRHVPLQDSELFVVVGRDHPWSEHLRLSIEELDKQLFVTYSPRNPARTWIDELFAQYDVTPMIVAEFDDSEAIKHAVLEGMEASILPCCAVRREVDEGRVHLLTLEEQSLRRPIDLLWNAGLPINAVARAFLTTLEDPFPDLVARVQQAGTHMPDLPNGKH